LLYALHDSVTLACGALLHPTAAHSDRVQSARFLPRDASVLATGGDDSTLRLWQL
jgi:WD40 repeat protein